MFLKLMLSFLVIFIYFNQTLGNITICNCDKIQNICRIQNLNFAENNVFLLSQNNINVEFVKFPTHCRRKGFGFLFQDYETIPYINSKKVCGSIIPCTYPEYLHDEIVTDIKRFIDNPNTLQFRKVYFNNFFILLHTIWTTFLLFLIINYCIEQKKN